MELPLDLNCPAISQYFQNIYCEWPCSILNFAAAQVARQSKVGWRGRRESALCQSRRVSRDLSQARGGGENRGRAIVAVGGCCPLLWSGVWWNDVRVSVRAYRCNGCTQSTPVLKHFSQPSSLDILECTSVRAYERTGAMFVHNSHLCSASSSSHVNQFIIKWARAPKSVTIV